MHRVCMHRVDQAKNTSFRLPESVWLFLLFRHANKVSKLGTSMPTPTPKTVYPTEERSSRWVQIVVDVISFCDGNKHVVTDHQSVSTKSVFFVADSHPQACPSPVLCSGHCVNHHRSSRMCKKSEESVKKKAGYSDSLWVLLLRQHAGSAAE